MKNLLKNVCAIVFFMIANNSAADYWKCPNNETQYVSKEAALNNCKTPDLCRRDCTNVGKQHHHFLSIRARHRSELDCKEVCGLQDLPAVQETTQTTVRESAPDTTVIEKKTTVKQRSNKFGDITETKVKEKTISQDSSIPVTGKNCRKVCRTEFVENPGLFGQGGIAGLGIGQARGVPRQVCTEVCD